VEGKGEWVNTAIFIFTPTTPLAGDQQYTVSVVPGLKSVDGAILDKPYVWSFHTLPPQVLRIDYASASSVGSSDRGQVLLDTSFTITFNQPVDQTQVESTLSLFVKGEVIKGALAWADGNTKLTVTPAALLKRETDYLLQFAATKANTPFQFAFHTVGAPGVKASYPANGDTLSTQNFYGGWIDFNTPMDGATLTNRLFLGNTRIIPNLDRNQRTLSFDIPRRTVGTYTITLKAGAKDIYGGVITQDYKFSFKLDPPKREQIIRPLINSDLMISPTFRGASSIPLSVPIKQAEDFSLYRMPPTELGDTTFINNQFWKNGGLVGYFGSAGSDDRQCKPPAFVKPENLVRSWSLALDPKNNNPVTGTQNVALTPEKADNLPPGLYWLTMGGTIDCIIVNGSTIISNTGPEWQFGIAVATANLTIKRGTEDIFVFVTDFASAKPVPGAAVTLYAGGKVLGSGTTDEKGGVQLPLLLKDQPFVLITAEAPGLFGAWYNNWVFDGWRSWDIGSQYLGGYSLRAPDDSAGYLYTDRPIYRPGDTVRYRGILRAKSDVAYPVAEQRTAYLIIGDVSFTSGTRTQETEITLSDFGTFSGDYTIPADAQLGGEYIWVSLTKPSPAGSDSVWADQSHPHAEVSFTVAAYRAPEYDVKVTADKQEIIQGDSLSATANALYYFGSPVNGANLNWTLLSDFTSFDYTGPGRYSFSDAVWWETDRYSTQRLDEGSLQTDADGNAAILSSATLADGGGTVRLTVEGTVIDESGQAVSGRATVTAHPANLYIGIGAEQYFGSIDKPLPLNLITVTPDSKPKPDQAVEISFEIYDWTQADGGRFVPAGLATVKIRTGADGKAVYNFKPRQQGYYRIRVRGKDEQGRANSATLSVWLTGSGYASWLSPKRDQPITLITDRQSYRPGDVAEILIPSPYQGRATLLITAERAGVITHDVLETNGGTLVYKMPIMDAFAPNVYLTATFIQGVDKTTPNPTFRVSESLDIQITPVKPLLNVVLTASGSQFKPGQTAAFEVRVIDSDGKPVVAEVGLKLVDKAVLALLPDNSGPLLTAFFGEQAQTIYTDLSMSSLLQNIREPEGGGAGGGGGGGGGGTPGLVVRQNYETTPLWAPHVLTDVDGHASVSVKLPDNLTTWVLDARALTGGANLKVGQATLEIVTSLPLLIRPVTPRFFVVGDRAELGAVVNNNTGHDQTLKVSLKAAGVSLAGQAEQTVNVANGGRAHVVWPVTVEDAPGADLTFSVIGQDGVQDAAKPSLATGPNGTIPIYAYLTPDKTLATGGTLRASGSRVEGVALPPRLKTAQGYLIVRLDHSLAGALTDSLTYLRQYPHLCIEQTTSRFLPNLMTYRALRDLGQNAPVLEAELKQDLATALEKLGNAQNPDGSWGWFEGMQSDTLTTAYATLGLIEAQKAGFALGPKLDAAHINLALSFIKRDFEAPTVSTPDWKLNRQAIALYTLARAGQGNTQYFKWLFDVRERLSVAARAYLLLAYQEQLPGDPALKALTADLIGTVKLSATGAHWEEAWIDWWNWGSDIRTTAVTLAALVKVEPKSDLLPNVVRWLMTARLGDHWPTTQETAWSVKALADWMVLTGELRSAYTYNVRFNQTALANATVSPDTARESQTLQVAVSDLLTGTPNRLTILRGEGDGALYYTARFDLQIPAGEAKAVSRGLEVKREYFLVNEAAAPTTSARVGDLVTVRLTISTSQDLRYFVLEDKLAAGFEAVDPNLLTSSRAAGTPKLRPVSKDDPFWYWGAAYFSHTELRDQETDLYADYLPRGTYVYTYTVRASLPGAFQVVPANAYTFYFPDIFGRSDGMVFTITQ
jgi:uncharacterized protein YfaS (alpha-2-macroglobulin family)